MRPDAGDGADGSGPPTAAAGPDGPRRADEELREGGEFPVWALREWEASWPGLRAGVTAAVPGANFGLASGIPAEELLRRLEALGRQLGFPAVAVGKQVHGRSVATVPAPGEWSGIHVAGERDGHVAGGPGVLLVVTAADCVPVYAIDPERRCAALLHAGWRGASSGVVAAGLRRLTREAGTSPERLRIHLGPGICGECYEVGPEVLRAFGAAGDKGGTLDLRRRLARQARREGVPADRVTASGWCTRCGPDQFHSYRGTGTAERMAAFLGWRKGGEM